MVPRFSKIGVSMTMLRHLKSDYKYCDFLYYFLLYTEGFQYNIISDFSNWVTYGMIEPLMIG